MKKKERSAGERGGKVFRLIPLNLDGYMYSEQWDLGTHAREIRSRGAADFRSWETQSAKKKFSELVKTPRMAQEELKRQKSLEGRLQRLKKVSSAGGIASEKNLAGIFGRVRSNPGKYGQAGFFE